ncbi:MAG TPA: PASTA domain-containing protein [Chitinophagales bacterium]|nr:PASTA domain-containing protein [Chitinophagales bacterium]HNL84302.1 PASTA domain-containing protein [Chitinophagales bacterium]
MAKLIGAILSSLGISIALLFLIIFSLNAYTKHGQEQEVPNVKGKSFYDAKKILSKSDLDYIVVDSSYTENLPPLAIIDQQPRLGNKVKKGRKIYLTVNTSIPPSVKIPNLIDVSKRQAEIILSSWGLKVGQYMYVPDMALDAVQNMQIKGRDVKAGEVIPKGTAIDLVLGDGFGNQMTEVPPLTDLTVIEAKEVLKAVQLNLGNIIAEGKITDTSSAYVFDQDPKYGVPGKLGDNNSVTLYIRQEK